MKRRDFLKTTGTLAAGAIIPMSLVEIAFGKGNEAENFTFAFISDSHIQQIKGSKFVRNWDMGLQRAVAECNLLNPRPDFVMYGGDIAQLGKAAEIDHGLDILSASRNDLKFMLGEHDYYLDLGEHWSKRLGAHYYSFDHKGVHFVVLNSILTDEKWTNKWSSGEERMGVMAGLDNPLGSPFMVGYKQRQWLAKDLAKIDHDTPVVVFSHSPLQKIYKGWNFWTDDAELIQAMLKPFKKVNVIYGHVHQIQYNQIGNITFHSVMATSWPWPYPSTYKQAKQYLPKLTVEMNRADPFFERDATGWQFVDIHSGNIDMSYVLPNNENRVVGFNAKTKRPEDKKYQDVQKPPQKHY
ncbi:MAG: metallophosphoesterase [Sulfurimonadaceae bacterium]